MQRLDASDVVGLCNDELYRRYCAFPGVYSAPHDLDDLDLHPPGEEEESADPEKVAKRLAEREEGTALYHACEAQYFHSQLPLTENADSSVSSSSLWSKSKQHENRRKKKTYVSKEFAQIGSTEACSSLRAMKKKLNECHKDEEGFFYIVQLRTERLNGDVEIVLDEYRNKVENESTSEEEDRGEHQLPLADYEAEVARRIATIKAIPRQSGVSEIRIPGERGYATRQRLMRDGIEIERKIYDALGQLAKGNLNHGA